MIPVRLGFHALSLWGSTVNQSWMQWARVHCQRRGLPSPSLAALGRSVQDPSLDGVCAMHRGLSYITSFRNTFEQAIDGGEWSGSTQTPLRKLNHMRRQKRYRRNRPNRDVTSH